MKITENHKTELELDLPKMNCDYHLKYYDKKTKSEKTAEWLQKTPLPYKSGFALAFVGTPGSGKTSLMTSIICSFKKSSRVYAGCFDKIYLNINPVSLSSIGGEPFKKQEKNGQIFPELNESFLEQFLEILESNREDEEDTLLIIDDFATRLATNRRLAQRLNDLLNVRRHYRLSILFLCQDLVQLPLNYRNSLNGIFLFKPVNLKRIECLRTEYLDFNHEDFRKFCDYVWNERYDTLYMNLELPVSYYKNFKKLEITKDEGNT